MGNRHKNTISNARDAIPFRSGIHIIATIKAFISILVVCSAINFSIICNSYATAAPAPAPKDTLDTIIDILSGLTCETQGIGDLLRTEFSHTCIPSSFFTFAIANIILPGLYANTMLRLKINDKVLFATDFPEGQCARNNKIDPRDPKLTFALCSNAQLTLARVEVIAEAAIAIAKCVLIGGDPWTEILEIWGPKKTKFHQIYRDKKDGYTDVLIDVPLPVPFKVVQIKDTMCVAAPSIIASWVPVGCKYIAEPYPESIYSSFMSLDGGNKKKSTAATDPMAIVDCGMSKTSCYQRAYNNSKTAIVISSPLIECIKEMTTRLLVSRDVCTFDDVNKVINSSKRESSILFQFQRNMHRTVTALLTIYVIFFGFKLILSAELPPKNEIINFVLKILFVTYFSVGININPASGSDYNRLDGMVQWAFPLLLGGIDTLAGWVMNASPSELCKFDGEVYSKTLSHMALWDALDCRISHYLGLDMLSTLLVENAYKNHDFKSFDFFSFSAPPYVYLLIPAIISGNMTLISLALSYPLLVISVGAFMINATIMCIISIVILGVLAPLFVPMFLFEYTRGYFESWVKLLISFLLQPMVVVTFMIMMFSVYDLGFYGHCKYISKTIGTSIEGSLINNAIENRPVKIFFVNNNWQDYATEDDIKSCKNSLGYMLNNPLATMFDFAKDNLSEMVKEKPGSGSTGGHMAKFQFLQAIVMGPGMFFVSPKLLFEKIKDIVLALITACFTLYLMYHFSSMLAEFAADMTEGVQLSNVAIHPQAIFKAGMAALGAAGKMKAADKVAGEGGSKGAKDMMANREKGDGSAGDTLSTGDGGSSDTVATGGSKSLGGSVSAPIKNLTQSIESSVSEGGEASKGGSVSSSSRNDFVTKPLGANVDVSVNSGLPIKTVDDTVVTSSLDKTMPSQTDNKLEGKIDTEKASASLQKIKNENLKKTKRLAPKRSDIKKEGSDESV